MAVIRTIEPFVGQDVQPIPLIRMGSFIEPGTVGTISGWGIVVRARLMTTSVHESWLHLRKFPATSTWTRVVRRTGWRSPRRQPAEVGSEDLAAARVLRQMVRRYYDEVSGREKVQRTKARRRKLININDDDSLFSIRLSILPAPFVWSVKSACFVRAANRAMIGEQRLVHEHVIKLLKCFLTETTSWLIADLFASC